jgi:hypothetical protein
MIVSYSYPLYHYYWYPAGTPISTDIPILTVPGVIVDSLLAHCGCVGMDLDRPIRYVT